MESYSYHEEVISEKNELLSLEVLSAVVDELNKAVQGMSEGKAGREDGLIKDAGDYIPVPIKFRSFAL